MSGIVIGCVEVFNCSEFVCAVVADSTFCVGVSDVFLPAIRIAIPTTAATPKTGSGAKRAIFVFLFTLLLIVAQSGLSTKI